MNPSLNYTDKTLHITPDNDIASLPYCGADATTRRISASLFITALIGGSDEVNDVNLCAPCQRDAVTKALTARQPKPMTKAQDVICVGCHKEVSPAQIGLVLTFPPSSLCWECIASRYENEPVIVNAEYIKRAIDGPLGYKAPWTQDVRQNPKSE